MIQRYSIYEIVFSRSIDAASNPFVDVTLSAAFAQRNRMVHVDGFYDGDGIYRIRLMPDQTGEWTYATHGNLPELDDQHGSFIVGPAAPGQHGPVRRLMARISPMTTARPTARSAPRATSGTSRAMGSKSARSQPLPADRRFTIEVIDTWEMTITELPGTHSGDTRVELPARSNIALRVRGSGEGERGRSGEGVKRSRREEVGRSIAPSFPAEARNMLTKR